MSSIARPVIAAFLLAFALLAGGPALAEGFKVGTWKPAQTIQPFLSEDFLPPGAQ